MAKIPASEKGGIFTFRAFDRRRLFLWEKSFHNTVTKAGLSNNLNVHLQSASWYLGLVNNAGFSAFDSSTDTMASHPGWTEYSSYSQATRPAWASSLSGTFISNAASPATFTFTGTAILKGAFLVSDNVKGASNGILFASGAFPDLQTKAALEILEVTYATQAQAI